MMARPDKWYEHAKRIPGRDAGVMDGTNGTRKVVLHTEGVDRGRNGRDGNAINLAHYVAARNIGYHFVIDRQGRIAQLYPVTVASRALLAGPWSPNRQGDIAIQVCFAGIASARQLDDWPLTNWNRLVRFFDSWDIPRRKHVDFNHPQRSEKAWRRSGYTSHAHAPFNDHTDGQGAPIHRLLDGPR